jgi:hypothetical protein
MSSKTNGAKTADVQDNVITPFIKSWNKDFILEATIRLSQNPTDEQFQIFCKSFRDYYGNDFLSDLILLQLKAIIDAMPDPLPSMTPKQRQALFLEAARRCLDLSMKWNKEFHAIHWYFRV